MARSLEKILNFWEKLGISKPPGNLVTHKDLNQVSIEINTILNLLSRQDILLDVGCGNGFATSIYAKKCLKTVGIDYSKNMIASAKRAYMGKKLYFEVGDALAFHCKKGMYTTILCTRCLINLTSWKKQKQAIENLHSKLNKGGRLILAEGIQQGRDNLNKLRNQIGLPSMPKVWHNIDFDEHKLFPFLKKLFLIKQDIRFGIYDVLTRVVYPAFIYPYEPNYRTNYHSVAEKLFYLLGQDIWRECSREACLVLIKK